MPRKAKVKKPLTKAEIAVRRKCRARRRRRRVKINKSYAAYIGNQIIDSKSSRERLNENEKIVKARKKSGLDNFTNPRSYYRVFPDEISAFAHYKKTISDEKGRVHCPFCKKYTKNKPVKNRLSMVECKVCQRQYSILKGSMYEKSHIPLHLHYDLLFEVLFSFAPLAIKEAQEILECSMKSAHAALTNARIYALTQHNTEIPEGSTIIIDTMYIIGKNSNRKDGAKLKRTESRKKSLKVLTVKVKRKNITLYFVMKDDKAISILPILRKILPKKCKVICDEGPYFNKVDQIKGKEIKLKRVNHKAGDHGDGSAESSNGKLKKLVRHNGNTLLAKGVQGVGNAAAFKFNNAALSVNQQFNKAIKNGSSIKKLAAGAGTRRRSIFVKLVMAWHKLHPGKKLKPGDIQRERKILHKIIKANQSAKRTLKANPQVKKVKRTKTKRVTIVKHIKRLNKVA